MQSPKSGKFGDTQIRPSLKPCNFGVCQLYTTGDDVQTQHAHFFRNIFLMRQRIVFKKCYVILNCGSCLSIPGDFKQRTQPIYGWISRKGCNMVRTTSSIFVLACLLVATGDVFGEKADGFPDCILPREQDQIWLVSTRHLGFPNGKMDFELDVLYYDGDWHPSTEAEFFATDDATIPTCVWIDGNKVTSYAAKSRGLDMYHHLVQDAFDDRPIRYVIWSWPTEQIPGPLKDARAKAWRSNADSYYMGGFLARMDPNVPVTLVGYSLGARIATGALHLINGGTLVNCLFTDMVDRRPVRAVLIAAAMHNYWLNPGQFHDNAIGQADRILILKNYCDPVLKWYGLISKCGNPAALGYTGAANSSQLGADVDRIEHLNVTCIIGKTHDLYRYIWPTVVREKIREYIFDYAMEDIFPAPDLSRSDRRSVTSR